MPWFSKSARAGNILVLTWGIGCFILNLAAQSNLRAQLMKPVTEMPIDDMNGVILRGEMLHLRHD